MIAVNGDALLTRDEAEAFAEFEQEVLEVIEESGFDLGLGELRGITQLQKFQHKWVFDEILRRVFFALAATLFQHLPLLFGQRRALKKERIDLAFEFARRPMSRRRLGFVEGAGVVVFDFQEQAIMRPRQFSTQCVEFFRKGQIELAHIPEIISTEPFLPIGSQMLG